MNAVEAHYDRLLAEHYTWMKGGFDAMLEGARRFVAAHRLGPPRTDAIAVDLGCGPGAFSIALAEAGFSVIAIDSSRRLLEELDRGGGNLSITPVNADLLTSAERAPHADLIVCMGDTLPHLPTREALRDLFALCAAALRPDGRLVLEFRDLGIERRGAIPSGQKRRHTDTHLLPGISGGPGNGPRSAPCSRR